MPQSRLESLRSITISKAHEMSLAEATGPEALPLRRWMKADERMAEAWVVARLVEVNAFCGSLATAEEMRLWGSMIAQSWVYSCEGLMQALGNGIRSGKIYGKLTYPVIAEWLNEYEARITGQSESDAARHKFRDNGGRDELDRMEAASSEGMLRAANRRIRALEQKLRNKDWP